MPNSVHMVEALIMKFEKMFSILLNLMDTYILIIISIFVRVDKKYEINDDLILHTSYITLIFSAN